MENWANKALVIVPPPPSKFTLSEWYLNNRVRYRCNLDQQQLAERVRTESQRIREKTGELSGTNKKDTDHSIDQRIEEIEFRKQETEKQRKDVVLEIDALVTYKERIMDAMQSIKDEALRISKKCVILREGRVGIDLVYDDVDRELLKEVEVIQGAQALLTRTLEQANEQVRRLRACLYFMDRDLEDKQNALKIDRYNRVLDEHSFNLSLYHGSRPLDPANITAEEWQSITDLNFQNTAKEINSAISVRSYVDTLLKQIIEDLLLQYNLVNEAFRRRIEETKEAKTKLELQHYEIVRQANDMMREITELEKAIAEKEVYIALAHTRLGFRCQRPGLELCRDPAEAKLVNEVKELAENVIQLQMMVAEAQASLRYLLKTQIQIEEDINVKMNTLKIDEVDCMTIRQSINYHAY